MNCLSSYSLKAIIHEATWLLATKLQTTCLQSWTVSCLYQQVAWIRMSLFDSNKVASCMMASRLSPTHTHEDSMRVGVEE